MTGPDVKVFVGRTTVHLIRDEDGRVAMCGKEFDAPADERAAWAFLPVCSRCVKKSDDGDAKPHPYYRFRNAVAHALACDICKREGICEEFRQWAEGDIGGNEAVDPDTQDRAAQARKAATVLAHAAQTEAVIA